MKNTAIKIYNETIHPGERISLALPLPELHSCAPLYIPVKVICGKFEGPCMIITAAIHGNEFNGTEIINRLLAHPALSKINGTLIAIPVVNVYGLINRTSYIHNHINLNKCFPGVKNGEYAARIANLFTTEIFSKANLAIDLRTGPANCSNLPKIITNINNDHTKSLAQAFNSPVILHTVNETGSLQEHAASKNIPMLTYEAGEAMRFDERSIKLGVKGIINTLRYIKMLPEKSLKNDKTNSNFHAEKYMWVRAPASGIATSTLKLGQFIKKGDKLSIIKDPFGCSDSISVHSPEDGIVISINNIPLLHEGEEFVQIASFNKMKSVTTHLEKWEENNSSSIELVTE